jgi:uncharacterized membrane protein (UPF0127 family)
MMRVFFLSLLIGLALAPDSYARPGDISTVTIETASGPIRYTVEMADDDASRERGLMFRVSLPPDRGMLFDFFRERPESFWMRNTLIPLDIIFIRADGRIANVAAQAKPGDETPIPSDGPVRAVLEIAGGAAAAHGIRPGDRVRHEIFP